MATPLVLLPGMNCSPRLWAGLDLGSVITPVLTEPTLDGQVERLLDELPERFALAGLSLGAVVAMALIRTAPGRVERLGLLSTNPCAPTPAQLAAWQAERRTLAAGASARDLQADLLPVLLSAGAPAVVGRADAADGRRGRTSWPWMPSCSCRPAGSTNARAWPTSAARPWSSPPATTASARSAAPRDRRTGSRRRPGDPRAHGPPVTARAPGRDHRRASALADLTYCALSLPANCALSLVKRPRACSGSGQV